MNDIGVDLGLANSITGITLYKTDMLEDSNIVITGNAWYCSNNMFIVLSEVMLAKLEDLPIYLVHDNVLIRELAKYRMKELNA